MVLLSVGRPSFDDGVNGALFVGIILIGVLIIAAVIGKPPR